MGARAARIDKICVLCIGVTIIQRVTLYCFRYQFNFPRAVCAPIPHFYDVYILFNIWGGAGFDYVLYKQYFFYFFAKKNALSIKM